MDYGLIGEKLGHSYSKVIHGMLGAYNYELYPISPEELDPFINGRGYKGLNVTIPYKQQVLALCDGLDPMGEKIGAVNTLYFKGQELWGTNTDYEGFLFMAKEAGISLKDRKVLVLGSGGASRMVQVAARDEGAASVSVASRKGPITYDALPQDAEIIVNTTPVGTYPHVGDQPVDLHLFPHCKGVLDLIYNPFKTRLILQSEGLGIPFSGGFPMLVAQATAAAEYFTGKPVFRERNEEIIRNLKEKMVNLVLIGMPGSGKTTLGKALSQVLDMPFVDTDLEIARRYRMPVPKLIERHGIEAFRRREKEVTADLAKEHGKIIATGGGIILDEENMNALRQNGKIFYIKRPLEDLPLDGRPLSKDLEALKKMSVERTPLYEKYGEVVVENAGSLDASMKQLLRAARF